ncbi:Hpt domain-containing protein [Psychrobacter sp. I-STPA10]|uniref:Hpt domain-containing protein n=1 Tax=Psychrobacter sp. I-STPA10 TaxID=2585769 RepID=UPI001E3881C8|nr:Hpt domain-containing protein [Psychrobacter sp. I-STPA10]
MSNTENTNTLAVIDDEQFCEIKELFEEEFEPLMRTYMQDSQRCVQALQTALANADDANGFESAHALKGASSNVGATQLHHLCYQMQEVCRDNRIAENADLLAQIEQQVILVNQEISQRLGD